MNKSKTSRVCIPCSTYVLTFYLLMSSQKEIDNTFFFFAHTIPENIRNKFPNSTFIDLKDFWHKNKYVLALYTLVKRKKDWAFIFDADIYGLDFYWDLLRGLKMNYIEDCPNVLDIWENSNLYHEYKEFETYSLLKKKLKRLFFGEYYQHPVGTSSMVTTIYTSSPYNKSYHKNKKNIVKRLSEEWESSSTEKKQYILGIFDLNKEDLQKLVSRKVILLTQAFVEDGKMSDKEQIEMYRTIIEHYGEKNIIIKKHPRDGRNYEKEFPKALHFNKNIPMQMLAVMGVSFECVATVNSSSALSFGAEANIDWWGEQMDEELIRDEGFLTLKEAKQVLLH
ncbi:lipooligosaccharide sialyltransferase (LST) [Bacteroides caecimuris]|uniref:Lipooligosaccharide sialyltransferase (LST) n=2 Tax=Bacteroides caecimuris TaxID=1796613 RepID=A0A4S2D095_9BACE|nr:lipooligosaccharide sialyltransferase (LST) [Bacteroides caecimuris]